jgi:hypothetical protein
MVYLERAMKKLLRSLLAWLDRKFPDRVMVDPNEYASMKSKVLELDVQVKALQTQMANINLTLGFSAPKFGTLER